MKVKLIQERKHLINDDFIIILFQYIKPYLKINVVVDALAAITPVL